MKRESSEVDGDLHPSIQRITELEKENERLQLELEKANAEVNRLAKMFADDCYIESANMEPGCYDISIRGKGAMILCGQLLQMFRQTGGKNFITNTLQMSFGDPETSETFELAIRNVNGSDTPEQRMRRQARRITELQDVLSSITFYAAGQHWGPTMDSLIHDARVVLGEVGSE